MKNGYLLPSSAGLRIVTSSIQEADECVRDQYRTSLQIGLQWNAEVTIRETKQRVSQAYCSALPVAYGHQPLHQWTEFASLILEAAYEATFCAALLNSANGGSNKLFLTMLGGGAFGNDDQWIIEAIHRSVTKYRQYDLDVTIISYRSPSQCIQAFIEQQSSLELPGEMLGL